MKLTVLPAQVFTLGGFTVSAVEVLTTIVCVLVALQAPLDQLQV